MIASAGFDRKIFIWTVYDDNKNTCEMVGHNNAIMDLAWTDNSQHVITSGSDKLVMVWDLEVGKRVEKFRDHKSKVNSCVSLNGTKDLIASCSDDTTIKIFDSRESNKSVSSIDNEYPSLCVDRKDKMLYACNITNEVYAWDIRNTSTLAYKLYGHTNMITGLKVSHDKSFLLSNSADETLKVWDIRPFSRSRLKNTMEGFKHGVEKNMLRCSWSSSDRLVACGSADSLVNVFDAETAKLVYRLPGHKGSVNEVVFHPFEPILLSCSSDCTLYLGELAE